MNQAQTITLYQPMLQAIAFNILKCKSDAEDIVQETFLKWLSVEQEKIKNTKAYLIKSVTNNCISHLNTLKKKKEQCLDSIHWSEMIEKFKETDFSHIDFEQELSKALKVLQHKLEPLERAVYVLKEVFDFDYAALQVALDKKQDHCRQLFCRAKKKLSTDTIKFSIEMPQMKWTESFRRACTMDQATEFIAELKKDISLAINKKTSELKSIF
ncbi:MAG TPA: sigma factor [Cyclobacteriaceae bacterium]